MAIKISGTTVIDDSRNVTNVGNVGDASSVIYGDGSNLTGIEAGGGGGYDTTITNTEILSPAGFIQNMYSFPSTAGKQYVINSISAANVGTGVTYNIIAGVYPSGVGNTCYFAYNVPIAENGLVELAPNTFVVGPSDQIHMWTTNDVYSGAVGVVTVYMNYTTYDSTDYVDYFLPAVSNTNPQVIYTSTSNPTTLHSIRLTNNSDDGNYSVSVTVTPSSGSTIYLAKDLIIPRYASVDILQNNKRIETNDVVKVIQGTSGKIDTVLAGKKIV